MADFEQNDIVRIAATLIYDQSEELVNVYHVLNTGSLGREWATYAPEVQAYMDLIMATVDTELSTLIHAGVLSVSNITQQTVFGSIAWGTFSQGGAAGEPTAAGVSCFVYARTRVPRVQIRKYYGVFPQTSMVDGSWDAGVTDACADSMGVHIVEQDLDNAISMLGIAYNRTLLTYQPGITIQSNSEPSYQRRRRRGVGS